MIDISTLPLSLRESARRLASFVETHARAKAMLAHNLDHAAMISLIGYAEWYAAEELEGIYDAHGREAAKQLADALHMGEMAPLAA